MERPCSRPEPVATTLLRRSDPIQLRFLHPPRAGVLFNLRTGQVLWQRNAYLHVRIASLTKMMTALLTVKAAPPNDKVLVTNATNGDR